MRETESHNGSLYPLTVVAIVILNYRGLPLL